MQNSNIWTLHLFIQSSTKTKLLDSTLKHHNNDAHLPQGKGHSLHTYIAQDTYMGKDYFEHGPVHSYLMQPLCEKFRRSLSYHKTHNWDTLHSVTHWTSITPVIRKHLGCWYVIYSRTCIWNLLMENWLTQRHGNTAPCKFGAAPTRYKGICVASTVKHEMSYTYCWNVL